MKISIIINNYNYGRFLEECIKSALAQTYIDKEIIIVDDGSTDNSVEIIDRYRNITTILKKPNGGQASAFNAGLALSSGDIIIFLDSDDILKPECLDIISKKWEAGVCHVHFNLDLIDSTGLFIGQQHAREPLSHGQLSKEILDRGSYRVMPTSGNAFSRAACISVFPIPENLFKICADMYLFCTIPFFGLTAAHDESLGCYRIHGGNLGSFSSNTNKIAALEGSINREIYVNSLIQKNAALMNLSPNNALIRSYGHNQKLALHSILTGNRLLKGQLFKSIINLNVAYINPYSHKSIKTLMIHIWMVICLLVPTPVSVKMIDFAYACGGLVFQAGNYRKRAKP